MPTTEWTREHLSRLTPESGAALPLIGDAGVPRMLPDVDLWDLWPVRTPDGQVAAPCGAPLWAALSAPAVGDPGLRHDTARIRLVQQTEHGWHDLGPLFPDDASLGSREWAGSTRWFPDSGRLSAYYTAAGRRGELERSFEQRIVRTVGQLTCTGGRPTVTGWGEHRQVLAADGVRYQPATEQAGVPGFIKAFRDPFRFDDPGSGRAYLLFTGSLADAEHPDFNGAVGIAEAHHTDPDGVPDDCRLLDPLLTADGVNNELERPHLLRHGGHHYLFLSTQARTFHPDVVGPTGLYGFVADHLLGPYEPLNGSGLVLRNPPEEPYQAYSWLVLPDLTVTGFVDFFALHGRHPDELAADGGEAARRHFGGTMTPPVRIQLDGDRATLDPAG